MNDMHIAWVTYISPQDMAFRSQMVPYPLFTTKFNVEGGTMQHHLTIKYIYIYNTLSSFTFSGDLYESCAMIS